MEMKAEEIRIQIRIGEEILKNAERNSPYWLFTCGMVAAYKAVIGEEQTPCSKESLKAILKDASR
jgi:hypothetical protein